MNVRPPLSLFSWDFFSSVHMATTGVSKSQYESSLMVRPSTQEHNWAHWVATVDPSKDIRFESVPCAILTWERWRGLSPLVKICSAGSNCWHVLWHFRSSSRIREKQMDVQSGSLNSSCSCYGLSPASISDSHSNSIPKHICFSFKF